MEGPTFLLGEFLDTERKDTTTTLSYLVYWLTFLITVIKSVAILIRCEHVGRKTKNNTWSYASIAKWLAVTGSLNDIKCRQVSLTEAESSLRL